MDPITLSLILGGTGMALDAVGSGISGARQSKLDGIRLGLEKAALNQRAQEHKDNYGLDRASMALKLRNLILGQPLMEQGMGGLMARASMGPARFGQSGAQNTAMQGAMRSITPGSNQTVNQVDALTRSILGGLGFSVGNNGVPASAPASDPTFDALISQFRRNPTSGPLN